MKHHHKDSHQHHSSRQHQSSHHNHLGDQVGQALSSKQKDRLVDVADSWS